MIITISFKIFNNFYIVLNYIMDVVVTTDKQSVDINSLPGIGMGIGNGVGMGINTPEKSIDLRSEQQVVNEAPSSVKYSKANESMTTNSPQIKNVSQESVTQSSSNDSGMGGVSISVCVSCLIMSIIASVIAYYLYNNPDKLQQLLK